MDAIERSSPPFIALAKPMLGRLDLRFGTPRPALGRPPPRARIAAGADELEIRTVGNGRDINVERRTVDLMAGSLVVVPDSAIVSADRHTPARKSDHSVRDRTRAGHDASPERAIGRTPLQLHGLQDRLAMLCLVLGNHVVDVAVTR